VILNCINIFNNVHNNNNNFYISPVGITNILQRRYPNPDNTINTMCEQHTHVTNSKRRYYLSHLETSTNNSRINTIK
jgi:queuine/archaeosine tRNA-ribosyltransferase